MSIRLGYDELFLARRRIESLISACKRDATKESPSSTTGNDDPIRGIMVQGLRQADGFQRDRVVDRDKVDASRFNQCNVVPTILIYEAQLKPSPCYAALNSYDFSRGVSKMKS
jgi:hypothetical protein